MHVGMCAIHLQVWGTPEMRYHNIRKNADGLMAWAA